jgi:hypothetical protein
MSSTIVLPWLAVQGGSSREKHNGEKKANEKKKRADEVFPFLAVSSPGPVLYLSAQSKRRMKNEMRQTHRLERQPTVRSCSGNNDEPTTRKCAAKRQANRGEESERKSERRIGDDDMRTDDAMSGVGSLIA